MATIFHYLCWAIGTLTLTLFFQYLVEFFRKSTDDANRESIKGFLWITGLGSLGVYLTALLPIYLRVYILFVSILLTFIMPSILLNKDKHYQVNLPPFNRAHLPSCHYYVWRDDYGAS